MKVGEEEEMKCDRAEVKGQQSDFSQQTIFLVRRNNPVRFIRENTVKLKNVLSRQVKGRS